MKITDALLKDRTTGFGRRSPVFGVLSLPALQGTRGSGETGVPAAVNLAAEPESGENAIRRSQLRFAAGRVSGRRRRIPGGP